jgi:hypothetical protein
VPERSEAERSLATHPTDSPEAPICIRTKGGNVTVKKQLEQHGNRI